MSSSRRTLDANSVTDRFKRATLNSSDGNTTAGDMPGRVDRLDKPDTLPRLDLGVGSGSPVSPLQGGRVGGSRASGSSVVANAGSTTTSSGSSTGSISGTSGVSSNVSGNVGVGGNGNVVSSSDIKNDGKQNVGREQRERLNLYGGTGSSSKVNSPSGSGSKENSPKTSGVSSTAGTGGMHKRAQSSGATSCRSDISVRNEVLRSSASSPANIPKVVPGGNLFPSGKVVTTGMAIPTVPGRNVLGSETSNYGHGTVVRGMGNIGNLSGRSVKTTSGGPGGGSDSGGLKGSRPRESTIPNVGSVYSGSSNLEELRRAGNEEYKLGRYNEALSFYDRAISLSPYDATFRGNKAAALMLLRRLHEAVKECEDAVRLNPSYEKVHHRLGVLYLRLGNVQGAKTCLCRHGHQVDPAELLKLQAVEVHLRKCTEARIIGDWNYVLMEGDAAIKAGADSSPQLHACLVESFLKLHKLEEAESAIRSIPEPGPYPPSYSHAKFFGIVCESYVLFVRGQFALALGQFEAALANVEKAKEIDQDSSEISSFFQKVRMVSLARARGNEHFRYGRFTEACSAYGEGLIVDPRNYVFYGNRAACWASLEKWERSILDCNEALRIQPKYTKALLRRALSSYKAGRLNEAVNDYEVLIRQFPNDIEIETALFNAQDALRKSIEAKTTKLQFGGEVENVQCLDQLRRILSSTNAVVTYFMEDNEKCQEISLFVNNLCLRYPSVRFLKVDRDDSRDSRAVATAEHVRLFPTFKIYKAGTTLKELYHPTHQVLEHWVKEACS